MGTIPDENDARRVDRSDRGEAPASGASDAGSRDCVPAVRAALEDLLAARLPERIPETGCEGEALALARTVNRLIGFVQEIGLFVAPLSRGELSAPMPSPDNFMAAPFKELHSRLGELTRQAQQIARGDYSQRVSDMGDFSAALNGMVGLLREREESLKAEIDGRAQAEEELQRERDLLVRGPVITVRWDVDDAGTVQYVSPNVTSLGYSAEEFVSGRRTYASIMHPEDYPWVVEDGNARAQSGLDGWTHEYRLMDSEGDVRWVRDYTHAVRDGEGAVVCYEGYIIDITPQKTAEAALRRREEQLRMLSLTDDLTGLYNRRGLFALGEHMMRTARRHKTGLAVLFVDLDELKAINDRYGHRRGDDALREMAALLKKSIRESDVLARAGGDEFVVVAEDGGGTAADLAQRLQRRLAAANAGGERPFQLQASTGIVYWPYTEKATLHELIERADARMYEDKAARKQS
jgi:diguanylate cyclase (GGDEF)-like protein/PAS domain S-box-containing protein